MSERKKTTTLSPVSMYAGRGSDKNRSYMNAQQCFHFRGSRLRIAVAGCGICGTLLLIRSLTDFFPRPASGRRESRPATAYMETALNAINYVEKKR